MQLSDEFIRECLAPYQYSPTDRECGAIRTYLQLLETWNRRISLTSIVDTKEQLQRLFGESLFAVHFVPIRHGRLADVGTGAGFPGLALKIASPQLSLTLIESNNRKCAFLAEVVRALELSDVKIEGKRFEDFEPADRIFEFVTSRALGNWDKLLQWSLHRLHGESKVVLWLAKKDAEGISANKAWEWREPIRIPDTSTSVLLIGTSLITD